MPLFECLSSGLVGPKGYGKPYRLWVSQFLFHACTKEGIPYLHNNSIWLKETDNGSHSVLETFLESEWETDLVTHFVTMFLISEEWIFSIFFTSFDCMTQIKRKIKHPSTSKKCSLFQEKREIRKH